MKRSVLIVASVTALVIGAIALKVLLPHAARSEQAQTARPGSRLESIVREAKAKGQKQVAIPPPMVEYVTKVGSLQEALKYYTLVIATPVQKVTLTTDSGEIRTWNKFEIGESLTPKKHAPCADCVQPDLLPRDLLPLDSGQILVAERGGSVTVDGVLLVMSPEFNFELNERYLLFLEEDESGFFGRIMVGPDAIFKVTRDQALIDITDKPHSLKRIIREQYRGRLQDLRSAAKG